jgi:hypothetical protein
VKSFGQESKYNAMITWLFMKLIAARSLPSEDWDGFIARNRDLLDGRHGAAS